MQRVFLAGYYRTPMVRMRLSRDDQKRATRECFMKTLAELKLGMTDKINRVYSLGPDKFNGEALGLAKSVITESCQDRRAFGLNFVKAGMERIQDGEADIILYLGSSRRLQHKLRPYEEEDAKDAAKRAIQGNHANIFLNGRIVSVTTPDGPRSQYVVIKDEFAYDAKAFIRSMIKDKKHPAHKRILAWYNRSWGFKGGLKIFAASSFAIVSEKAIKDFDLVPIAELYNVAFDPDSSFRGALEKSLSKINPKMPLGALRTFETGSPWHSNRELIEELKIPKEYINRFGNELAFGDPGCRVSDFVKIGRVLDILKREKNDYGAVIVLGDTNSNDEILAAACLTLRRIHFWNKDSKAAL